MVKCVVRKRFPGIGPKGCTASPKGTSKHHKKSHKTEVKSEPKAPSKPAKTMAAPAFSPLNPPKKRIMPTAISSTQPTPPISAFTDNRVLTKGQESYKHAILALEKRAAAYDKKYKKVLKR